MIPILTTAELDGSFLTTDELDGSYLRVEDMSPRLIWGLRGSNRMIYRRTVKGEIELPGSCYLAGPMRKKPWLNFPAFFAAAGYLKSVGLTVYNPAERDAHAGLNFTDPSPDFDVAEAFRWDFGKVASVSVKAVVVLSGWEQSEGSLAELLVAQYCGKEIYKLSDDYRLSRLGKLNLKVVYQ